MVHIVEKILGHLIKRRNLVLAFTFIITIFFGWQALHVEIRADADSLLPNREAEMKYYSENGIPQNEYLVIGVERDNLFDLEFLSVLDEVLEELRNENEVLNVISPFSQTAIEKKGAFFTMVNSTETGGAPRNEEELEDFKRRMTENVLTEGIIISSDNKLFLILLEYDTVENFDYFMEDIYRILSPLRELSKISLSGNPPFEIAAKKYLVRDMSIFLSLGVMLILAIYYFGFNSKRSIFLPVIIIIIGTIWTVGFMSVMGFAISIVSIVVPPLVLTLGSSYSIHILNSYFRFAPEDRNDKAWISGAVSSVSSTIVLASLTTVVGFLSLLVTSLSQLQEFAVSSSFGILTCSIMSMTVLPCALSYMGHPKVHQTKGIRSGLIARFTNFLFRRVIRHRILITIVFLMIPVTFVISYPHIKVNTDYADYFPDDDPVSIDLTHLSQKMKGFSELTVLLRHEDENAFLDRDRLAHINQMEEELLAINDITSTRSFNTFVREAQYVTKGTREFPSSRGPILFLSRALNTFRDAGEELKELVEGFVNEDYTRFNITFRYYDTEQDFAMGEEEVPALLDEVNRVVTENLPEGVTYEILGPRLFFQDLYNQLTKDLALSTITAFVLIFIVSSYTFKSFTYGILSLIPMLAGVLLNFVIMVITGIPLDLTTVMVSCVSIGIGVDDSIHFLLHYKRDGDLKHTMELTGRPIILTSLSIIAGLILLLFSTFRPIGYFGILICITLLNTTIGCLIFLPSFIALWEKWGHKKLGSPDNA